MKEEHVHNFQTGHIKVKERFGYFMHQVYNYIGMKWSAQSGAV